MVMVVGVGVDVFVVVVLFDIFTVDVFVAFRADAIVLA